jgi:meso-butanediol dehydrogenase / (S,S)-butanediol dehydrogenase / diacetyl reductase
MTESKPNDMRSGPVAVITGGGSGIGGACVQLFASRGYRVVAVDLVAERLASVADIEGVSTVTGDVAEETTNIAMVALAAARFGRLDTVVLNAGIGGVGSLESDGAIERFDRVLAVNVRGVALGIRAAVPLLREGGGGSIIVTSSVSGLRGDPGTWGYNASKAASLNLVRAAALDYAVQGIRINALAPGLTATDMTASQREDASVAAGLLSRIPMHRWSHPSEQAEVVWFLASPAASYITGAIIPVDGGLSANGGILPPPRAPWDRPTGAPPCLA